MLDLRIANIQPDTLVRQDEGAVNALVTDLNAAGGGYDFLLQASNAMVAESAFGSLHLDWVTGQIDAQAAAALRAVGDAPVSAALTALLSAQATAEAAGADLLILFSRKDVLFDTPATCRVRADVRLALGKYFRLPPVPSLTHTPTLAETVESLGTEIARIGEQALRQLSQIALAGAPQQRVASQLFSTPGTALPVTMQLASGTLAGIEASQVYQLFDGIALLPSHVNLGNQESFDVSSWLGAGVLEIPASFGASGNQAAATIRACADVSASDARFTNLSHDAALLLSASDPAGLVATTTHRIRERAQVDLVDEISLVGAPATARVNNLAQLNPQAFPCGQGACPLSVAATIVAWHVGAPNTIKIVGQSGYGVLWSAEAVSLLVHYCWDNNYFPRSIPQSTPMKLVVDGNEVDAAAESDIKLETLRVVALEHDANGRTDVLHLAGNAQVVPRRFVLSDGRVLLPGNPPDPIFAPGDVRPWNAIGTLIEQKPTDASPDIALFEQHVTYGTTSRLGRPFTGAGGTVNYSCISAYAQRILLLTA